MLRSSTTFVGGPVMTAPCSQTSGVVRLCTLVGSNVQPEEDTLYVPQPLPGSSFEGIIATATDRCILR